MRSPEEMDVDELTRCSHDVDNDYEEILSVVRGEIHGCRYCGQGDIASKCATPRPHTCEGKVYKGQGGKGAKKDWSRFSSYGDKRGHSSRDRWTRTTVARVESLPWTTQRCTMTTNNCKKAVTLDCSALLQRTSRRTASSAGPRASLGTLSARTSWTHGEVALRSSLVQPHRSWRQERCPDFDKRVVCPPSITQPPTGP